MRFSIGFFTKFWTLSRSSKFCLLMKRGDQCAFKKCRDLIGWSRFSELLREKEHVICDFIMFCFLFFAQSVSFAHKKSPAPKSVFQPTTLTLLTFSYEKKLRRRSYGKRSNTCWFFHLPYYISAEWKFPSPGSKKASRSLASFVWYLCRTV